LKEELEKVKEELREYKEAINGYREKIDRLESEKADLKMIYGNKLWKFLQNRFHLVDEEYDEMMKFLDS
jgi:archaellum component FlaC